MNKIKTYFIPAVFVGAECTAIIFSIISVCMLDNAKNLLANAFLCFTCLLLVGILLTVSEYYHDQVADAFSIKAPSIAYYNYEDFEDEDFEDEDNTLLSI